MAGKKTGPTKDVDAGEFEPDPMDTDAEARELDHARDGLGDPFGLERERMTIGPADVGDAGAILAGPLAPPGERVPGTLGAPENTPNRDAAVVGPQGVAGGRAAVTRPKVIGDRVVMTSEHVQASGMPPTVRAGAGSAEVVAQSGDAVDETQIRVRPASSMTIVDPSNGATLPAEGQIVPRNSYWLRRLADGDVVEVVQAGDRRPLGTPPAVGPADGDPPLRTR